MPRRRNTAEPTNTDNPYEFVSIKIHKRGVQKLDKIAKVLAERAASGFEVPIRFDLGRAHLVDVMADRFAKQMEIDL